MSTFDRLDLQALTELRWTANGDIATAFQQAPPEARERVASLHWLRVATRRPKTSFGGIVRGLTLRAIGRWARAFGVSTKSHESEPDCAPEGCLCSRCPLLEIYELGLHQIANELHAAHPLAISWMIRDGHRRARAEMREALSGESALLWDCIRAAFEELAVARGVDLEERGS